MSLTLPGVLGATLYGRGPSAFDPFPGPGTSLSHPTVFAVSDFTSGWVWDGADGSSVSGSDVTIPADNTLAAAIALATATAGVWYPISNEVGFTVTQPTPVGGNPANYYWKYGLVSPPDVLAPIRSKVAVRKWSFAVGTITNADGSAGTFTIDWDFGDGGTATGSASSSIDHQYASGGTYIVSVKVTDSFGRWFAWVLGLVVNQEPVASFTWEVDPDNELQVNFDASASTDSDGTITRYDWDFGDGDLAFPTTAPTVHIYDDGGDFDVTLRVYDGIDLSDPVTHTVTVEAGRNAACFDHAGTLYSALKDDDDPTAIRIYRFENFTSGSSPRETMDSIADAKAPSLWSDQHGDIWCSVQNRSTGAVVEYRSQNRGKTFDLIP